MIALNDHYKITADKDCYTAKYMPPAEPKRGKREMSILAVLLLVALAFGLGFFCGFVVGMCAF